MLTLTGAETIVNAYSGPGVRQYWVEKWGCEEAVIIMTDAPLQGQMRHPRSPGACRVSVYNIQISPPSCIFIGLPRWLSGQEPACQYRRCKRCGFSPCVGKRPWRRTWQPAPVFFPGEFHRKRSLVGYSPWGCKESDTTEQMSTHTHCIFI